MKRGSSGIDVPKVTARFNTRFPKFMSKVEIADQILTEHRGCHLAYLQIGEASILGKELDNSINKLKAARQAS